MPDTVKPVVRLEQAPAKRAGKVGAAKQQQETIKLAVRLTAGVNDALRTLIRYRGDLSKMALEALSQVDLSRVGLVSADEPMVADTTISMPKAVHQSIRTVADDRQASMNIVVNTALAHWLAKKGALRLA